MQLLGTLFVIFVGMILGGLMLFNTIPVPLHLDPFSWRVQAHRPVMVPLWQIMLGAVVSGWFIGQLLEWVSRTPKANGGGGSGKPTETDKDSVDARLGIPTK